MIWIVRVVLLVGLLAGLGSGKGVRHLESGFCAGCLGHAGTQAETCPDTAAGCRDDRHSGFALAATLVMTGLGGRS